MSGTVYIKKNGKVAFQGLNNGKCQVKRYSETEPEVFTNNNSICSKPIYKNLVKNGYGEYGNNTNFSNFTYNTATNDFKINVSKLTQVSTDYYIPIDSSKKYNYSMEAYTQLSNEKNYLGISEFDVDKNSITDMTVMYIANTLTTLAKDLKNGDTTVYFNSLSNWNITSSTPEYQRGLIFWNYKNSKGYQYPALNYSRNYYRNIFTYSNVNKSSNTIKLNTAWSYGTIPKGTQVSQTSGGSTYNYSLGSGISLGSSYKGYSASITGTNYNNSSTSSFRIPTAYIKPWLGLNFSSITSSLNPPYTYIRNIVIEEADTSTCAYSTGKTWTYNYTGGIQSFSTPCNGTYKLEVWGAQGGTGLSDLVSAIGGYGGYSTGNVNLTSGTALYIVVGGYGAHYEKNWNWVGGGYNGGGGSSSGGGGGGGATHIGTRNGTLAQYGNTTGLYIVAGGGGGGGKNSTSEQGTPVGGSGGGTEGGQGSYTIGSYQGGKGGRQYQFQENPNMAGTITMFGQGRDNHWNSEVGTSGGGGGGLYGGLGGSHYAGGGGGSGYIGGVSGGSMQNGVRSGNGYARITLASLSN